MEDKRRNLPFPKTRQQKCFDRLMIVFVRRQSGSWSLFFVKTFSFAAHR